MKKNAWIHALGPMVAAALLGACAAPPAASPTPANQSSAQATARNQAPPATSQTTSATDEKPPPPPGQKRYKWSMASEADKAALDKKVEEAAKQFVQLKRDNQLMFCKRYREMGSNIPTLHCITEAELRKQVEDSDEVRQQMRNKMGKCDITSGCRSGF